MDAETRDALDDFRQHVDQRFQAMETQVDQRFQAMEARFQAMEARVDQRFRVFEERIGQHVDERLRETEDRLRRHFDVAVEAFRADFRVFGEGLHGVSRRVDTLDAEHAQTRTRVEHVEVRVLALERRRPPRRRR
jgi:DNA anti-recombination protein RmuC